MALLALAKAARLLRVIGTAKVRFVAADCLSRGTCKVSIPKTYGRPPPNSGRPLLLDHAKSDQDCCGQEAAENSGMYDPAGYGHVLIYGFLGGLVICPVGIVNINNGSLKSRRMARKRRG